ATEISRYSSDLNLTREAHKKHIKFLHLLDQFVEGDDSRGRLIIAADGCNIIFKIRCEVNIPSALMEKVLEQPVLAAGFQQQGNTVEIMLIQQQRQSNLHFDRVQIFLLYSPRDAIKTLSLEEAG